MYRTVALVLLFCNPIDLWLKWPTAEFFEICWYQQHALKPHLTFLSSFKQCISAWKKPPESKHAKPLWSFRKSQISLMQWPLMCLCIFAYRFPLFTPFKLMLFPGFVKSLCLCVWLRVLKRSSHLQQVFLSSTVQINLQWCFKNMSSVIYI